MKKTLLFTTLTLMVSCLVGCGKSEPTDKHLFELKGNVKEVQTSHISDVTSQGVETRQSRQYNDDVLYFDESGNLTSAFVVGYYENFEIQVSRDKAGNIDTLAIPCDGDFGFERIFMWDKEGYPIKEQYSSCIGIGCEIKIIYGESKQVIGRTNTRWEEGDAWTTPTTYIILEMDEKGNWTKRIAATGLDDDISYSLEERSITYYATIQSEGEQEKMIRERHAQQANKMAHQVSTREEHQARHNEEQQQNVSTTFRHERDVHSYLRSNKFTNSEGNITITESYNMGLCFNGRELTGAVRVCDFNSYVAYITASSPINGITYEFTVNCNQGVLSCLTDGTTYYLK